MSLKPYLRKTLYLLSVALLIALLVVLTLRQNNQYCREITIAVDAHPERMLVTPELVKSWLTEWYPNGLSGMAYKHINLLEIEEKLKQKGAIKNAEVSFNLRGILHIAIEQRNPVVRIYKNSENSYYVDRKGVRIPAAGFQPARVPVALNINQPAMIKKVYTLAGYVQENTFMSALTEQIFVDTKGDLIIVPKIDNQQIVIGDTTYLGDKFTKLINFYKEGLSNIGWKKYTTINVKFKDQVVCN
jgi:cell division protein FtsQ